MIFQRVLKVVIGSYKCNVVPSPQISMENAAYFTIKAPRLNDVPKVFIKFYTKQLKLH